MVSSTFLRRLHRQIKKMSIIILMILTGLPTATFSQAKNEHSFATELARAAMERTTHSVTYDGSYRRIPYPMGDVPDEFGVCTDVVIRSYRALGIDLQQLVHEDMQADFSAYPNNWGLQKPDSNIDHRRVPNLQTFMTRHGTTLPVTLKEQDYKAGDLVTWTIANHLPHIGIVTAQKVPGTNRSMIVHNIGEGPKQEDILFAFPITGHYRYHPNKNTYFHYPTNTR